MTTQPMAWFVAGADTVRHDQRHHAGHECQCRHQNRPQAVAARLNHGVVRVHSIALQLIRVIDLQNRVLLHDTEQHEQAEPREDVQRLLEQDQRDEREGQRQRQ